ncbi:MAG: metallophosphoesterase [Candidatus Omnitrophica bacterium]|nr:metallophosphoesterase [Candidatus Omnitrophota bacterium]
MEEFIRKELEKRFEHDHLEQRLHREEHHQTLQFRGGFKVYWENSDLMAACLRILLKCTGTLKRGFKNALDHEVVENTISLTHLPQEFHNYTILQISDLHIDGMFDHGKKLIRTVKDLHYDLCVFTGDFRFLTYGQERETIIYTKKLVDSLSNRKNIVGILGNHDSIEMIPALESIGIKMLVNESTVISRGGAQIAVAGVDDSHFYETADIRKAFKQVKGNSVKILLAHSQEIIEEASNLDFDLYLCGHTHGGQICLPGGIPIIKNTPLKYRGPFIAGPWEYGHMKGYTSRGSGASALPVRFNCRPEVTLHKLVMGD